MNRRCIVDGKEATFHGWFQSSKIVPPSPMIGGDAGGVMQWPSAVVEYKDGSVDTVPAWEIKLLDADHTQDNCTGCGYKIHSEDVSRQTSCNNCVLQKTCGHSPGLGKHCRINCFLWEGRH
jgi:hypothetical protein